MLLNAMKIELERGKSGMVGESQLHGLLTLASVKLLEVGLWWPREAKMLIKPLKQKSLQMRERIFPKRRVRIIPNQFRNQFQLILDSLCLWQQWVAKLKCQEKSEIKSQKKQ